MVGQLLAQKRIVIYTSDRYYSPAEQLTTRLSANQIGSTSQCDRSSFKGCQAAVMFVTVADLPDVVELTRSFVEAASGAGVERLVWVAPVCSASLGEQLAQAEAVVRSASAKAVILRHAPLISDLLKQNKEIKYRRTLSLPLGESAIPWLAPEDLTDGLLECLSNGQSAVLMGPQPLTGEDLAQEISATLQRNLNPHQYALRRFKAIDIDSSGQIDSEEMFPYLLELGYAQEEAQSIIAQADTNRDGSIDFEEFIAGLEAHLKKILANVPSRVQYVNVPRLTALYDLVTRGVEEKTAQAWLDLLDALQTVPESTSIGSTSVSDWLDRHALDFINVYILPGRGVLTINEGVLDGKPALRTRLLQSNNRMLVGVRTVDNKALEWQWESADAEEVVRHELEKGGERVLRLKDGKLVSLSVRGLWTGRRLATELFFQQQPIPRWQINLFRELGELQIEEASSLTEPEGIVCNCTQTTCGKLQELIEGGMDTLEQIADRTQVTMICGGCQPLVEELLGSANLAVAELLVKQHLGQGIYRFQFRPVGEAVAASQPGQHILIQGRVDGVWVTRAYTLSSPADQTHHYEIAVKREEMGLFSRWLCDRADAHSLFRISQPRGEYVLNDEQPVYFFAGGIGITPAIAMMRTLAARSEERPFHLDWSAPRAEDFVFHKELEQLSTEYSHLSYKLRPTRTQGRLSAEEIQRQYSFREGAIAFLCGPQAYMDALREHLKAAGWSDSAIRQELFSSQLDEEGKAQDPLPQRPVVQLAGGITPVEAHSFELEPVGSLATEAEVFLKQCYLERGLPEVFLPRWEEVGEAVKRTGTYTHTLDELTYGARLAWRNSSRCVGRYFWQSLQVRDMRHLETEEEMFKALVEHIKLGTNNGDIRAVMTVFKPDGRRLWNSQLLRYAGYRQPNGTVLGDPSNVELTEQALKLGWSPQQRTAFDYLPIIIQLPGKEPRLFEIPPEIILDVSLVHPRFEWFKELGLKWYALPAVCNMSLDLGGIQYTCMPFNGFYMGTEIGGRNFSDRNRYNMLPIIAESLGLDTSSNDTLWRDAALIELNIAVVHSFKQQGVRLIDHHTMTDYFMQFVEDEQRCQRPVHADWGWIVPPVSGSTTPVYQMEMNNRILKPNYFYMSDPWQSESNGNGEAKCPFHHSDLADPNYS